MAKDRASHDVVAEGARIQTFLIADVRGWTLFTQTRGDEVAAKLAARFAEVARDVVEGRDGHVLELRGDEAMCVFASARQAIRAAVDLQERFYEETVADPELPLPVGIGLDAGEAVPVEGGYRGGALNLAARLCGQAKAGEILASKGVTHLAQHVDGVRYVDRGRVRLKNLSEPVELVGVVQEGVDPAARLQAALPATGPPRRRSWTKIAIAAAAALVLLVGATIVLLPDGADPTIAAGSVGLLDLSGGLKGTVDVGQFPRGLAMGAGFLWAADQESDQLIQVDPSTFQVEERIPVGLGPTGVAFAAGNVWVANTDERTVSVVDPQAQAEVGRVDVGNGPSGIVADSDRVWVTNSVDATVAEIDAIEWTVEDTWPVGERPVAAAVGEGAVWVANASDASVSRVVSGQGETQRIPVGRGPASIAFAFGSLWVANSDDGTVTTYDPASGRTTTEGVGGGADALAPAGDGIWVVSARDGTVARMDPATTQVTDIFPVGNEPRAVAGIESGLWVGVEASPAAHQGGTLKLVTRHRLPIDPHGDVAAGSPEFIAASVLAVMYDGLVTYRKTGGATGTTVVPDLAVSLPSDVGLTYTFTLRDGIRFSDGHLLTPADVVATFERVLVGDKYGRLLLPELVGGSTCTPKDPQACDLSQGIVADKEAGTVTFHLVRPAPDFLKILATPWFAIVPAGTPVDLKGEPIPATGPYVIADVGEDGSLVLERNEGFEEWSADAQPEAFADRVEVIAGVNALEQVSMLEEEGTADLGLDGVLADLVPELERRASDQLVRSQSPTIGALALETASPPFDNVFARRALAFALDRVELQRDGIETAAFAGRAGYSVREELTVTCQILPPTTPGYVPYCPYTASGAEPGTWAGPDPSRAADLVRRSGTEGDEVLIAMSPCLEAVGKQVRTTLEDLGYEVDLELDGPLTPGNCLFGGVARGADVSYVAWANDYPSATPFMVPLLSCVVPEGAHPFLDPSVSNTVKGGVGDYYSWNFTNFCDPELDRRLQRAVQQTDPHASARAFEALDRDFVDLATMIPYGSGTDVWLVSKRVSNVEISPVLLGPIVSQVWVQ